MLLLVALAGLLAWAASLPLRARAYRLQAARHAAALVPLRDDLRYAGMMLDDLAWYQPALASDLEHWRRIHRETLDRIRDHSAWKDRFEQASRRPWGWVPTEPAR